MLMSIQDEKNPKFVVVLEGFVEETISPLDVEGQIDFKQVKWIGKAWPDLGDSEGKAGKRKTGRHWN